MHTKRKEKKKGKNGISMLWRKSKIVKIIYEYKTLLYMKSTQYLWLLVTAICQTR